MVLRRLPLHRIVVEEGLGHVRKLVYDVIRGKFYANKSVIGYGVTRVQRMRPSFMIQNRLRQPCTYCSNPPALNLGFICYHKVMPSASRMPLQGLPIILFYDRAINSVHIAKLKMWA